MQQKLVPDLFIILLNNPKQPLHARQVQKNSFISYVLSDQVWCCNIKWFLNYSKN